MDPFVHVHSKPDKPLNRAFKPDGFIYRWPFLSDKWTAAMKWRQLRLLTVAGVVGGVPRWNLLFVCTQHVGSRLQLLLMVVSTFILWITFARCEGSPCDFEIYAPRVNNVLIHFMSPGRILLRISAVNARFHSWKSIKFIAQDSTSP